MITYRNSDGSWGIHGMNIHSIPSGLYGAAFKLMEYEQTGLEPKDIYRIDELYREKCEEVARITKENMMLKEQMKALVETPAP